VLQGNVQSAGAKIRVNAQLTDTSANTQIWSESFDGDTSDLFALQDKVTTLIGNSMGRELTIRAARESEKRKGTLGVNDLLLRARALALKPQSPKNFQEIAALARQALVIDPDHVDAKLILAHHLLLKVSNFPQSLTSENRAQELIEARTLLTAVTKTDPENTEIPAIESILSTLTGNTDAAFQPAERYLVLNPKSQRAHIILGITYLNRGDYNRGTNILLQGLALNPKHPIDVLLGNLALGAFMAGDIDAAIAWGLKAKAANMDNPNLLKILASTYAVKGQKAEASALVAKVLAIEPDCSISKELELTNSVRPDGYFRRWFHEKMVPAMRLAGFPE
jgi:tetratricopeptide (TPR) repeat protein